MNLHDATWIDVDPPRFGRARVWRESGRIDLPGGIGYYGHDWRWTWELPAGNRVLTGHRRTWRDAMKALAAVRVLISEGRL